MRKVGIIGIGHVGATVAHIIVENGYADELVLIDHTAEKVQSEVWDFQDAASLLRYHTKVSVGQYSDLQDAEVVISALGHIDLISKNGDRFAELKANIPEVQQVAADLKASAFKGVLIATTNPNDVIVDLYYRQTGLPSSHVLGTGTYLDTARLKRQLGEALEIDPRSVEGYVLGEHGNSQFAAWSTVRAEGRPFTEIAREHKLNLAELEQAARQGGFAVHFGKGYTNIAIASATVDLMNLVLSDAKNVAICSHYDETRDSYISTPAVIGKNGVERVIKLELTADEQTSLQASADEIKDKTKRFA